jgi:hypothetical protein
LLISDLGSSTTDDGMVRVSATVSWEDCERADKEIYFATEAAYAERIAANPNAFLLAAFIPALYHGERRIRIQGHICPRLYDGVLTAIKLLRHWYSTTPATFSIESTDGLKTVSPSAIQGTACTMSGGIDSLATLRTNRLHFSMDHELSIRTCFLVYGLDVGGYENMPGARPHFDSVATQLTEFSEVADFTLIPVHTNLRHLDSSDILFSRMWFGAAIASIGHAFAPRISTLMIPSGNSISEQAPQGSHPLLDPCYGSGELNILHDGFGLTRLEKVGLVAEWEDARTILRSCYAPFREADVLNCGKCEKCLRTMAELLLQGKLDRCPTFPLDDLTPRDLSVLRVTLPRSATSSSEEVLLQDMPAILTSHSVEMWREMIEPLTRIGRDDLAKVVQNKVRSYDRYDGSFIRRLIRFLRSRVADIDRRFLGGSVKRLLGLA